MPPRSSDTQSTLCIHLRRSPRFLDPNYCRGHPETASTTPTPGFGNEYQVSTRSTTVSRSSSLRKSNKKDQNDESDRSSKKLVAINRGSSGNGEISVSRRTPRSSNGAEGILGLRRSPRFCNGEIDADKTCADDFNRANDCRTPRLKGRVGGIPGLGHCPRFSNPEMSRDASSHENKGFISNGDASLSAVSRTNGRVTRSSVVSPERRERKSRHFNRGRIKDNDSSEMKAKRDIVAGRAAKEKNGVLKKKGEGDMQQARCHSSSHLERRPKKANATAVALETGGEKEILKEGENDDRKQGKRGLSKHPESRLTEARRTRAVRPKGGRIEIECSYGKENEGGNASTQFNVETRQSRRKDKLRVKENGDSEMMLRGLNVAPVPGKENAVLRERGEGHMQQAGCHLSNHLKRQTKKRSKAAIKNNPEARGVQAIVKERENDDKELVRGDPSKNPKNRLTRLMRGKSLSVRRRQVAKESGDGEEHKGGNVPTSSDVEPGQGERKDNLKKLSTGTRVIGTKRKRKEVVAIQKTEQGWTQEQETALQRAYFLAKPTPHFWKKVARLVPGKSAQDCFDKVHSDNLTPPSSRTRSRTKERILSPVSHLSFSASKLLKSPEANGKKACKNKQKSHIVHRNVRHMLEKYCQADKDNRPDLFSVLEPTVDKSALLTPAPFLVNLGSSPVSCQRSSSGKKKRLSRFSTGSGTALTSPPVLKQVKNVALHEKYIDQLHIRDAKRKAASKHNAKCIEENKMETPVQHKDVINAARNALVSDACDAISKFKNLQQINLMDEFSDREEYFNDEDEEDDTL